jgi:hypothetical protein
MSDKLTKKADILMCLIYKKYKTDIKNGVSIDRAKYLGSSMDIQKTILPKWSCEDVDAVCCELGSIGFLDNFHADDIVYESNLTPAGIVFMENRFKKGLKEVLDYIGKIKGIVF